MSRHQVLTDDFVIEVCERLPAEGYKVTNEAVLRAAGRGSMTTICRAVRRWRSQTELVSNATAPERTEYLPPHDNSPVKMAANFGMYLAWLVSLTGPRMAPDELVGVIESLHALHLHGVTLADLADVLSCHRDSADFAKHFAKSNLGEPT